MWAAVAEVTNGFVVASPRRTSFMRQAAPARRRESWRRSRPSAIPRDAFGSTWMRSPNVDQAPLNQNFDPTTVNSAKCYDAVAPGDGASGTTGTVVDIFGNQTATLKKMSMVCVPSTLE